MPDQPPSPESFLRLIHRARRGRLKIYLGHAPGVGKTYAMLLEGQQLKARGVDVVVGIVEWHARPDTASLAMGLETVARREIAHRGVKLEELDVASLLARKPEVALIDELAHTNAPGSPNEKRWQDVVQVLEAGIHVVTTLNIQHLESLHEMVQRLIGVRVRERVPDWILAEADQIVHVDISSEDLHRRLEEGKVYPQERVKAALESFFRKANLEQLRQITLRELASAIERKGRQAPSAAERVEAPDQVAVLLSSRGPDADALLRHASRLAGRLDRTWHALYVQTPEEAPEKLSEPVRERLAATLELAGRLGATVFRFQGDDVAETVLRFTREYRVGHLVVGRPTPRSWLERLRGRRSLVDRLVSDPHGLTVTVVDTQARTTAAAPVEPVAVAPPRAPETRTLFDLVDARRIVIVTQPLTKAELLERLVDAAAPAVRGIGRDELLRLVLRREAQASTFLPEGIALPHVRLPQVHDAVASVAVLRAPLSDDGTKPIEVAFLMVLPDEQPGIALKHLSEAARLFRDGALRQRLHGATDAASVLEALRDADAQRRGGQGG